MLIDEEHIMLEAGVEMRFQAQLDNDGVVVTVDVGIDTVETLEDLADQRGEGFGEGDTWYRSFSSCLWEMRGEEMT